MNDFLRIFVSVGNIKISEYYHNIAKYSRFLGLFSGFKKTFSNMFEIIHSNKYNFPYMMKNELNELYPYLDVEDEFV